MQAAVVLWKPEVPNVRVKIVAELANHILDEGGERFGVSPHKREIAVSLSDTKFN